MGMKAADVTKAAVAKVVSAANPLEGIILRASAQNITTKAGNPFTKVSWMVLGDELEQETTAK
jgi:hypothetical protein